MGSLQSYLLELSDRLDKQGKQICADAVDDLVKTASLQKLAQYVGVIGYVLKQNRAMGNCIRKKRAGSQSPMQEVVLDCLKEYQDGQDYHDTEWTSKYAQVIQHEPQQFDVAHLFFLSTVGDEGKISEHIEKVEKVAVMLEDNGIEEEVFASILGHLGTLGNLLSKDSETHSNFKLAAPRRGWWSRFWNPSDKGSFWSAFNPRRWSRDARERGQDLDAIQELDAILNDLSSITRITQQIKTQISRLKAEAEGYTAGSGRELPWTQQPAQEDVDVLQNVVQTIRGVELDDWNRSALVLQQLKHLLDNTPVQNEYNQQIFGRAEKSIDQIFSSMETVYAHINSIQESMQDLRTRQPILGRDVGLTEQGRRNPFAQGSPAEEYATLQEILERLYQNPMNSKAQWYAQKAHGRLWDKLRYINRESDEGMQSWLQTPAAGPQEYGDKYDQGLPDEEQPPEAVAEEVVNDKALGQLYDGLLPDMNRESFKYDDVIKILSWMSFIFKGEAQKTIRDFVEAIEKQKQMVGTPQVGEETTVAPTEDASEDIGDETAADRMLEELMGTESFRFDNSIIKMSDLVKIADIVDEIDGDVADILDEFIKEYKKPIIDLTFPEFSVPVKELQV
jgi:hypothetical protein